jgi:hypothetical protein
MTPRSTFSILNGLLVAMALAGCTTYVGHKLPVSGALPVGSTGLPYTMTRLEYTVDITADSEEPSKQVFTLKKTSVPDASQRYTLALDPALLTNGKIELVFGDQGNITDSATTFTSQVVATFKALASFAVDQIAGRAVNDEASVLAAYIVDVTNTCSKDDVGLKISSDMKNIQSAAKLSAAKSSEDVVREKYFPRTSAQRGCLAAVKDTILKSNVSTLKVAREAYTKEKAKVLNLQPALKPLNDRLDDWIKAQDAASIESAKIYVEKVAPAESALLNALGKALALVNEADGADKRTEIATLFDMSPSVWRARYIKDLDDQLDNRSLELNLATIAKASPQAVAAIRAQIALIEEQRADAVGGLTLLSRIRKLEEFLADVKETTGPDGQRRIAAEEHIKLREERDRLRIQLKDLAIAGASTNDKGKAKVKAQSQVPVRIVKPSFFKELKDAPAALFSDLPKFVVVLEPIVEPAAVSTPTRIGGN